MTETNDRFLFKRVSLTLLLAMGLFTSVLAQSADALLAQADSLYNRQQYDAARVAALDALSKASEGSETQGDLLNLLSLIYVRQGNFDEAVKYAHQCNALDLKSGDADLISSSYNTLAGIYMSLRRPEVAEKYILQAISYARKTDNPQRMAVLHGMASEVYQHMGQYEQSLDYATKAYNMEKQLGRKDKMAIRQAERAPALIALERYTEAEKALEEAIPGLRESGNLHSLGIACNQMGQLMHRASNDSAAVRYHQEALQIFVAQRDLYNESRAEQGLYDALRESNPALAMQHNDRYLELRDSIYDKETGELLSKYAAELDNYQLLSDNQQMQRDHRLKLIIGVAVVAVLLVVIGLGVARNRRDRRRMHALIAEIGRLRAEAEPAEAVAATTADDGEAAEGSAASTDDHLLMLRIVKAINASLPTGHYGVEDIASQLNMTSQTFRRRLTALTGRSPKTFISAMQMETAAKLLTDSPEMPVQQVAARCGYDEPNSFGRVFRKTYGMSPTQYREKYA